MNPKKIKGVKLPVCGNAKNKAVPLIIDAKKRCFLFNVIGQI